MEVDLVSRDEFLKKTTLTELEALSTDWRAKKREFLRPYWGAKAARIRALLDSKRAHENR